MNVTVKDRQSLLDVAIQVLGSAEGVFALAERNGLSITDRLTDGQVLEYDMGDIVDTRTAELVAARGICPATEIPSTDEKELLLRVRAIFFPNIMPPQPLVRPGIITTIGTMYDSGVTTKKLVQSATAAEVAEVNVLNDTLNAAKKAAANNEPAPSESGQAVTTIFGNEFNDSFA